MARDGTHSRTARSVGALGPAVTLVVAFIALFAITKRRHAQPAITQPEATVIEPPALEALSSPLQNLERGETYAPKRRPPRFFTGTLVGITTGIVLGITAAVLTTVASPHIRSAVIVGVTLRAPPPTNDGEYIARIVAQDMNPTLVYADPDTVASLLAATPEPEEAAPVLAPVQQDLQDNAGLVFFVLGALTLASWALIMRGLSGAAPGIGEAVVE